MNPGRYLAVAAAALTTLWQSPSAPPGAPQAAGRFACESGVLSVVTQTLALRIAGGEVVYLSDNTTGEVFVDGEAPQGSRAGIFSSDVRGSAVFRSVADGDPGACSGVTSSGASVEYRLSGLPGVFRLSLESDSDSGDVLLRGSAVENNSLYTPISIEAPVVRSRANTSLPFESSRSASSARAPFAGFAPSPFATDEAV